MKQICPKEWEEVCIYIYIYISDIYHIIIYICRSSLLEYITFFHLSDVNIVIDSKNDFINTLRRNVMLPYGAWPEKQQLDVDYTVFSDTGAQTRTLEHE